MAEKFDVGAEEAQLRRLFPGQDIRKLSRKTREAALAEHAMYGSIDERSPRLTRRDPFETYAVTPPPNMLERALSRVSKTARGIFANRRTQFTTDIKRRADLR